MAKVIIDGIEYLPINEGMADKARELKTNIAGLNFTIGSDGVWMNTSANGRRASINLSNLAIEKNGVIGSALLEWCRQLEES